MRHPSRLVSALCDVLLFVATFTHAQQPWSNILSPSRAIDWSKAGLPATLPDGETTPNRWTPPVRTQCGSTVPSGTPFATIVSDMAACPQGTYLLLGPGSFTLSASASLNGSPYVTLRGSGPMSTTITFTGTNTYLQMGQPWNQGGGTVSASPAAGTTSVTLTGVSGVTPTVGNVAWFNQCDTGWSGSAQPTLGYNSCTTGAYSDNGAIFVCGGNTICNSNGANGGIGTQNQSQYVLITSVVDNGSGSYTIGFSPGLYLPNWSTSNTAAMYWGSTSYVGYGIGLEDMSIVFSDQVIEHVQIGPAYASWIKGVRFVAHSEYMQATLSSCKNCLFSNNYLFSATPSTMNGNTQGLVEGESSDSLVLNNIAEQSLFDEVNGPETGNVIAYNYAKDVSTPYVQPSIYMHMAGATFMLFEGNQNNSIDDDDTWGAGALDTFFRNWESCGEEPYSYGSPNAFGISIDAFHRFDNAVANVIGGSVYCTSYSGTANGTAFRINHQGTDALTASSLLRWANYDTVSAAVRCVASEVPTSLSGNAAPWSNPLPSTPAVCGGSGTLPASLFMNTISAHPAGGTGLSWWKVCTSGFNASTGSCGASSTTVPFPPTGPDVTGGNYVNGFAYDNPAHLAWRTLPVDTTFQKSYTITGSSWASGTETLTVSGLPSNINDIMGPFQISGGNCATSGAGTATGTEVYMTSSTSTTVTYSLASDPGSCTGTMLWPDVRQFDERVYQSDPSGTAAPNAPSGLGGSYQPAP